MGVHYLGFFFGSGRCHRQNMIQKKVLGVSDREEGPGKGAIKTEEKPACVDTIATEGRDKGALNNHTRLIQGWHSGHLH